MSNDVKLDELVELKQKYGLWLKPVAKLNISVQLPQLNTGKSISTTSVMEKINKRAKVQFKSLKITKTTIDFLRLEGELETLKELDIVEQRLNRVKIKLDGFDEQLKLKANKVKIGPFKHDWETFFRDNPHMDELKPGYRPDTVLIQNLPLKWFSNNDALKTNWLISAFNVFGDIRRFHIPLLDDIEKQALDSQNQNSQQGFKKFNFNSDNTTFDVYLMYKDYVGFMNCMDGLRGMKLVKRLNASNNRTEFIEHEIKLDFDRTKHLSDKAIRRRQIAKKYGINTLDDLNEYKKKAKERKILCEQYLKQLKKGKKSSKNLLNFLARLVEVEEKKREEEEQKALNERLLKERLIEEEKKLRNKLIERQRSLQLEKAKETNDLKGDQELIENLSNDKRAYNISNNFNNSNSNQNSVHYNESNYKDNYSNCRSSIHQSSRDSRAREFVFKNSDSISNDQNYDIYSNSLNRDKQYIPRPSHYKAHFNPYQQADSMIPNSHYQAKQNYYKNSYKNSNYAEKTYDVRSYDGRSYNERSNNERSYNERSYNERSNNERSSNERSCIYNQRPFDDRQPCRCGRCSLSRKSAYEERAYEKHSYINEVNDLRRSHQDRFSANRLYDKPFVDRGYNSRNYNKRSNMNKNSYDDYHLRTNSSLDAMDNRYGEFEDESKEKKSLKSFVVLPKR